MEDELAVLEVVPETDNVECAPEVVLLDVDVGTWEDPELALVLLLARFALVLLARFSEVCDVEAVVSAEDDSERAVVELSEVAEEVEAETGVETALDAEPETPEDVSVEVDAVGVTVVEALGSALEETAEVTTEELPTDEGCKLVTAAFAVVEDDKKLSEAEADEYVKEDDALVPLLEKTAVVTAL